MTEYMLVFGTICMFDIRSMGCTAGVVHTMPCPYIEDPMLTFKLTLLIAL